MALKDTDSKEKFFPVIFHEVPEEFKLKAKNELYETEENVKKGLEILKECIRRENLPFSAEENMLMVFLRSAKFNFKKAEEKLIRYRKIYQRFQEMLDSTSMERIRAVIDSKVVGLLPYRDNRGRAVLHSNGSAWNKELYTMDDATVCMMGLVTFASLYPLTSISGIAHIGNCYLDSIYDCYPIFNAFRKMLPVLNWMPIRFSRTDFVNEYAVYRYLFQTIKLFIAPKLRNRVFFHGHGFESLRKEYSPAMLPTELGGTMGPLSTDSYKEKFLEFMHKHKFEYKHSKEIKFCV